MTAYPLQAYGGNPHANVDPNAFPPGWGSYQWPGGVPGNLLGRAAWPNGIVVVVRTELVELAGLVGQILQKFGTTILNPGCWSYENRPISGTRQASNHSKGRAIDISAPQNPQSHTFHCEIPPVAIHAVEALGWYWGGRYVAPTKYDAMHIEFVLGTDQVPAMVQRAQALLGGANPEEPDLTPAESFTLNNISATIGRIEVDWYALMQQRLPGIERALSEVQQKLGLTPAAAPQPPASPDPGNPSQPPPNH